MYRYCYGAPLCCSILLWGSTLLFDFGGVVYFCLRLLPDTRYSFCMVQFSSPLHVFQKQDDADIASELRSVALF